MSRFLKVLFLSMIATMALTGCPGGGNNAQAPYPGGACGAPGQPPCYGPNNNQFCSGGQVWNGATCVPPALSPGGYIHYFGALSGVDAARARDIIATLQG